MSNQGLRLEEHLIAAFDLTLVLAAVELSLLLNLIQPSLIKTNLNKPNLTYPNLTYPNLAYPNPT